MVLFTIYNLVLDKKKINIPYFNPFNWQNRRATRQWKFFLWNIFDLQKVFDKVDHDILIQKLNHYGIRGVANNWFSSYLQNRSQYVSINGFNSKLEHIHCGVPQGSILGPLLFLIYINDLNCAIRYCSVHHFADDTNLLNYNNSVKRMNKQVNQDLKNLTNWLNAN